jgi:drug/metabolite transporter (DMT)-like permease
MYGIVLMLGATLFQETSSTLGKIKVRKREESIFSMGFLNTFFVTVFFIAIAIIRPDQFIFSFASIGTLTLKIILDIFQAHYTMLAITRSERSTFGFLRVITLPLLLVVDLFLGYSISALQLGGMMLIIIVLFFLFLNHGIRRK